MANRSFFFKMDKAESKIKIFIGTSQNALLTQIWNTMYAYLLISLLKFKSKT